MFFRLLYKQVIPERQKDEVFLMFGECHKTQKVKLYIITKRKRQEN